jgi:hypothetical protein
MITDMFKNIFFNRFMKDQPEESESETKLIVRYYVPNSM